MRDRFVSQQTRMLLERMDMYPDEFVSKEAHAIHVYGRQDRWQSIIKQGEFNLIEHILIRRKYRALKRAATQTAIMDAILEGDNPTPVQSELPYITTHGYGQERMRLDASGNLGIGVNSAFSKAELKIGSESLSEEDLRQIKTIAQAYDDPRN